MCAARGADYNNPNPSQADHQNGARDVRKPGKRLPAKEWNAVPARYIDGGTCMRPWLVGRPFVLP